MSTQAPRPRPATADVPPRRPGWAVVAPAAALVLVALCLRGPFAAVGPVLGELGDELSLSTAALAVVTALPLVCFGLLSPFAPALAARIGLHRAAVAATAVLLAGIVLRLAGAVGLFAGTVLLTGGIAIVNVLLPALARAEYGTRSAVVLGATTGSMALSASLGAGLAQPLADAAGSAGLGLAAVGGADPRRPAGPGAARPRPARDRRCRCRPPGGAPRSCATAWPWPSSASSASRPCRSTRCSPGCPTILEDDAGVSPVAAGGLLALAARARRARCPCSCRRWPHAGPVRPDGCWPRSPPRPSASSAC